jgi:hypothetical protein
MAALSRRASALCNAAASMKRRSSTRWGVRLGVPQPGDEALAHFVIFRTPANFRCYSLVTAPGIR